LSEEYIEVLERNGFVFSEEYKDRIKMMYEQFGDVLKEIGRQTEALQLVNMEKIKIDC
jgi:hypothetical protein